MSAPVDVAIVGGGMAGAGLALLLAQKMPALSICLLEQYPLAVASSEQLAVPSFDARSTALSCSSQAILAAAGLWPSLVAQAQSILQVHVSERSRPAGMLMQAAELALPALGYVIENRLLGNVLLAAVLQQPQVRVLSPAHVERIGFTGNEAVLAVDAAGPCEVRARLVVIADGAQSVLRQQLGIAADQCPYDQHALIANIAMELPHRGVAYERFTDTGPVALLPLPDHEGRQRAALVWTLPDSAVDEVMAMPDDAFLARVQQRFGGRCGRMLAVGARHAYPLVLVQAREQVRSRLVLLGSAAHHLHPVAGQGFNLILRDCAALAETLMPVVATGGDIGDIAVLQRYYERQQWDQQKTVTVSDWLPRLFSNRDRPQQLLRTAALLGLDFLPGLRGWFTRAATGV